MAKQQSGAARARNHSTRCGWRLSNPCDRRRGQLLASWCRACAWPSSQFVREHFDIIPCGCACGGIRIRLTHASAATATRRRSRICWDWSGLGVAAASTGGRGSPRGLRALSAVIRCIILRNALRAARFPGAYRWVADGLVLWNECCCRWNATSDSVAV